VRAWSAREGHVSARSDRAPGKGLAEDMRIDLPKLADALRWS